MNPPAWAIFLSHETFFTYWVEPLVAVGTISYSTYFGRFLVLDYFLRLTGPIWDGRPKCADTPSSSAARDDDLFLCEAAVPAATTQVYVDGGVRGAGAENTRQLIY